MAAAVRDLGQYPMIVLVKAPAVFLKDGKVIDGRYAVQTHACNTQTYAVSTRGGQRAPGFWGRCTRPSAALLKAFICAQNTSPWTVLSSTNA